GGSAASAAWRRRRSARITRATYHTQRARTAASPTTFTGWLTTSETGTSSSATTPTTVAALARTIVSARRPLTSRYACPSLARDPVRDLAHLRLGHLGIRLVLEMCDALPAARVAHRAEEHDDAPVRAVANERERLVHRQRGIGERDRLERPGRIARDRRDEREVVAVGE